MDIAPISTCNPHRPSAIGHRPPDVFGLLAALQRSSIAGDDVNPILGPESGLGNILALNLSSPSEAARLMELQKVSQVNITRASFVLSTVRV